MYTLNVSIRAFFPVTGKDRYGKGDKTKEAGVLMLIPIVFFTIVNILFGLFPGIIMGLLEKIAGGVL